ncbi:SRPBCC family protein [Aminobacter anthyllidis]|uniref:SRPBCC family protein n=1 Tax=Aminobacter anthyllidis TaxID=1035067 RepID=A0A9X1A8T1_9HYPH|nr:SRPBCC family protein [Aminobacter anthyllidis]MBT1155201.1 SRPBCC family protein [Aminobacter anthyllidis]
MTIHTSYGVVTEPGTVRIERLLPGPAERIWSYLTDSDKRSQWLAGGPMELRAGGQVENVFRNSELTRNDDPPPAHLAALAEHKVPGEIIACEPPYLLAYSWGGAAETGERSEVRFELEPRNDKVLLTVTHRRLTDPGAMLNVAAGWHTHLGILAARLEGREPDGFWRTHTRLVSEYAERFGSPQAASRAGE